jgi:hypothetical protein
MSEIVADRSVRRSAIWREVLVVSLLALAMASSSLYRSAMLHELIYQYFSGPMRTTDVWFDADIPRAVCMALDRGASQHETTSEHPLLSTLFHVPAQAVIRATGIPLIDAMRWVLAVQAGLWIAAFYGLLRLLRLRIVDAVVFAILAASTAASVFWTAVPESWVLGAISLLVPAFVILRSERSSDASLIVAGAISLSVTITNWLSGLLAALVTRHLARAVQTCINALVLVAALGGLQWLWFPRAEMFPGNGRAVEYVSELHWPAAHEVVTVFALHSIVMPSAAPDRQEDPLSVVLGMQSASAFSGGLLKLAGAGLWMVLVVLGVIAVARGAVPPAFRLWLAGMIAGQLVLHLIFGRETFLYAMHFAPLLVLLAACAALGAWRRAALALAIAAIVVLNVNNLGQFQAATDLLRDIAAEAAQLGAVFGPPFDCR